MSRLSYKNWWVVGLASLAITVVAVVQAAIPDPSGVIHACYRANGNLRLVDKSNCTSSPEGQERPKVPQVLFGSR
jgi:hypothetical protein